MYMLQYVIYIQPCLAVTGKSFSLLWWDLVWDVSEPTSPLPDLSVTHPSSLSFIPNDHRSTWAREDTDTNHPAPFHLPVC